MPFNGAAAQPEAVKINSATAKPEATKINASTAQQETSFNAGDLFKEIAAREGSGDTLTSTPTAHFGVTESAAKAVGLPFDVNMSEARSSEIGTKYVEQLEGGFSNKIKGWRTLPTEVRNGAVDAAYNMGPQVFKFKGFIKALENKDIDTAAKELLDTANEDGKAVKGLATRRAKLYNKMVSGKKIDTVEATKDGIRYLSGKDEIFFYKKPLHSGSKPGVVHIKE